MRLWLVSIVELRYAALTQIQHGPAARPARQVDVLGFVADDIAFCQSEVQLRSGRIQEAWPRMPAATLGTGLVQALYKSMHLAAFGTNLLQDAFSPGSTWLGIGTIRRGAWIDQDHKQVGIRNPAET